VEIRTLTPDDIGLLRRIDRSEIIRTGYTMENGRLVEHDVAWDSPPWDPDGDGEHSVAARIEEWRPVVAAGARFLGAFDGDDLMGVVIVDPTFEDDLAWLAFLHVSRPFRRSGAASALWDEAVQIAIEAGATHMYVSATPSASAVGFYRSKGCEVAVPPHPALFAKEPEDIHFTVAL